MFDFNKFDEEMKAFEQKPLSELTVAQFRVLMYEVLIAHGMNKLGPANSVPGYTPQYPRKYTG